MLEVLLTFFASLFSTVANVGSVHSANRTNKALAAEANAMQIAESEKAYDRSKATNQVALLRQAGMSPAAAVGALREGGSYTPAPINTAQVQPVSMDNFLESTANSIANVKQRKQEKVIADNLLESQERQSDKKMAQDDQHFKDELMQRDKLNQADIDLKKSQQARAEYDLKIQKLRENPEDYGLYSHFLGKADPTDFSSAYKYVQAVTDGKDISASVREALTSFWSQANTDSNVSANTGKTKEETNFINKQVEDLKNKLQEWQDSKNLREKERLAGEAEAELRKVLADNGQSVAELEKHMTFDENGNPNGWTRYNSFMSRLWDSIGATVPLDLLGKVLKAAVAK